MSLTLLKYNTSILLEVVQNYETLLDKEYSETSKQHLHTQIKVLKNQILFLLTAIKKEVEKEKNA